jgi:putative hemolysin
LNAVGNGALRLFGLKPASGHEMVHSVEELRLLVTGMQQAGVVDVAEARIARRAFAFGELTAASLMTPRTEIEAVPVIATLEELLRVAETTRRNRLPVYEGSLDHVVGILYIRGLFRHRHTPPEAFALRSLIRPPLLVPEMRHATQLLEDMRARRCHVAMVVDEYGGTAGMVTLRDLLEALVGRIDDMPSNAVDTSNERSIADANGAVLLDGLMRVEELEEAEGIRVDDDLYAGVDTIGGLFTAVLERFPEIGDEITIKGRTLRVEARDGLRVATVRLLSPPRAPRTGAGHTATPSHEEKAH